MYIPYLGFSGVTISFLDRTAPCPTARASACSKDALMARSEDGISRLLPPLRVSGTFQMSPLLHALDDGDDPHQVPEQLVQLCMFY